ncbi:Vps53p KNAG_0F02590 [Huiozyma naganishii CBS 8797]|uniref:Vps53 N-terminal domain-containing protein n=1 Tax=Huiozyma naganishii (strain ATCC MYA-139 / BCRC 22969 / CBS 8797 / KCTC 17520 / NBRC 10181 / NCYC 3082 / Yp74L-3) TaxID=1071383 RepID=J7S7E0_HUIN7|nr:hypothetical protein KNAG_0F02590 [Kazachstania naganishii CBS 8797]CCK70924.1 hypothetical protein KNAG_0F02590 [Kazachstania naganishii CBS 8797]
MSINSIDYDPFENITSIFLTKDSLQDIDSLLATTRQHKVQLQEAITIAKEAQKHESGPVAEKGEALEAVVSNFNTTQKIASSTEATITKLIKGLVHLDNAKHNLTNSLNLFQNLKILVDSYYECCNFLKRVTYLEMVSPYRIMCSLSENIFSSYKSVSEVNKLLNNISKLKSDIISKIKKTYTIILNGKSEVDPSFEKQIREGACELLDSNSKSKDEIIEWTLNKLLYEIKQIFQFDDEAGSLENLERRYIFFKKVLNNFNSKFASFFLPTWEMPLQLVSKFFSMTRKDLDILLKVEFKDRTPSIDLFMKSLQVTLDFEKYIDVRFSNKFKEERLSKCFEPYLSLWVSHQDGIMNKKMLTYMSEEKIPKDLSHSLVVPSTADMFRTYRTILTETLELVGENKNNTILASLSKLFAKWLIEYSNRILKPLLLPENVDIQEKFEVIKYTVLLINTCDYCSTTIDQLEEKLSLFSSGSRSVSDPFIKAKDVYDELISNGNRLLLKRVVPKELSFAYKEFDNTDWAHVLVEDYSRYMVTLKKLLTFTLQSTSTHSQKPSSKNLLEEIVNLFNRDVYKWNFFDSFIDLITTTYVDCIIRLLQPLPPFASSNSQRRLSTKQVINIGEQLLLDMQLLKQLLSSMCESVVGPTSSESPFFKRAKNHLDTNLNQLLSFIKLLVVPLDSPEDYYETYGRLTLDNSDPIVWAFTISLKGAPWDLGLWKKHWEVFHRKIEGKNDNDTARDFFIYRWDPKHLSRFEANIRRIQDSTWSAFFSGQLKIKTSSTPSTRH